MKTDAAPLKALSLASRNAPGWMAACRGAALGLAFLAILNLLEPFVYSNDLVRNWLTDLRPLTPQLSLAAFTMFATSLLLFSMRPALPAPVMLVLLSLLVVFIAFCGRDLWLVSQHMQEPARTTALMAPLTKVMWLIVVGTGVVTGNSERTRGRSSGMAIFLCAVLSVFGYCIATVQSGRLADTLPDSAVPVILALNSTVSPEQTSGLSISAVDKQATALMLSKHGQLLVISGKSGDESERSLLSRLILPGLNAAATQIAIDTDSTTFDASLRYADRLPQLQQDRRIIIVVGNELELARIRVLASRCRLVAIVVPVESAAENPKSGMLVLTEAVQLLKAMLTPAIEFAKKTANSNTPSPLPAE